MPTTKNSRCDPMDIAMKSFFLGPQAENGAWVKELLGSVLTQWFSWRASVFPEDGQAISSEDQRVPEFRSRLLSFRQELHELLHRFEAEIPKFSPRYVGHMFSETSLPALFGHLLTLLHNPNNISGEASRVGVQIESEAIHALCRMVGYAPTARGHFTSGGTLANIEALLRARMRFSRWLALGAAARSRGLISNSLFQCSQMGWARWDDLRRRSGIRDEELACWDVFQTDPWTLGPKIARVFGTDTLSPVVLIPGHAHYSWKKAVSLLGLGDQAIWEVALESTGALSVEDLRSKVQTAAHVGRPILMVVSVLGTTELGRLDPVDQVSELLESLQEREGIDLWHHVDAAYGGFFRTLGPIEELSRASTLALDALGRAHSITLDPHKLGYVPYSSGAFLCASSREYELPKMNAPYIQYVRTDCGQVTIEGSRSAAGAVATYLTARSIGLDPEGYGRILRRTIQARARLAETLTHSCPEIRIAPHTDTNILCFHVARRGESFSSSNSRTLRLYRDMMNPSGEREYFVSKTDLSLASYGRYIGDFTRTWEAVTDTDQLTVIRLCLMNPFIGSKQMKIDFYSDFARVIKDRIQAAETPPRS